MISSAQKSKKKEFDITESVVTKETDITETDITS